jgi:hypothetical protein
MRGHTMPLEEARDRLSQRTLSLLQSLVWYHSDQVLARFFHVVAGLEPLNEPRAGSYRELLRFDHESALSMERAPYSDYCMQELQARLGKIRGITRWIELEQPPLNRCSS